MANSVTIIKKEVERLRGFDDYEVSIGVKIKDAGDAVLLEKDYSVRYNSSTPISDVAISLQNQIKGDWDKLEAEKVIFDASAFDSMVSDLRATATSYVNP